MLYRVHASGRRRVYREAFVTHRREKLITTLQNQLSFASWLNRFLRRLVVRFFHMIVSLPSSFCGYVVSGD